MGPRRDGECGHRPGTLAATRGWERAMDAPLEPPEGARPRFPPRFLPSGLDVGRPAVWTERKFLSLHVTKHVVVRHSSYWEGKGAGRCLCKAPMIHRPLPRSWLSSPTPLSPTSPPHPPHLPAICSLSLSALPIPLCLAAIPLAGPPPALLFSLTAPFTAPSIMVLP